MITALLFLALGAPAPATIEVTLPAEALLKIDGNLMATTGSIRTFTTPPLEGAGTYDFEASLPNGQSWCQEVKVKAGETTKVEMKPVDISRMYFGVEADKIKSGTRTLNGKPVTRLEAMAAICDATLPNDTEMPYLTVIGSEAERKHVLGDMATSPALAPFRSRWRMQEYSPSEWPVQGVGFHTEGTPVIYLQKADGVVMHRQDSYDGPEKLAVALRKADPSYDPKKDPDLTKPAPLNDVMASVPPVAWGGLAAIGGILFLGSRKKSA